MKKNQKKIRHWLIQKRMDSEMTFKEISQKVGVTPQCLYYWEVGERTPSPKCAKTLANVLGFEWTRFYDDISSNQEGG